MAKTYLETAVPILKLLKYVGVFPFEVVYEVEKSSPMKSGLSGEESTLKILPLSGWRYVIFGCLLRAYIFIKTGAIMILASGWTGWGKFNFFDADERVTSLIIISGTTFTMGSIVAHDINKGQIMNLLNQWHRIEKRVLNTVSHRVVNSDYPRSIMEASRRKMILMIFVVISWLCIINLMGKKNTFFLHSVIRHTTEVHSILLAVSLLDAGAVSLIIFGHIFYFEVLSGAVAKSVTYAIKNISPGDAVGGRYHGLSHAVSLYYQLHTFAKDYNQVFAPLLVLLKVHFMVFLCCYFYFPLRYHESTQLFSGAVMLFLGLDVLKKMLDMMVAMGQAREEAERFKPSWLRIFPDVVDEGKKAHYKALLKALPCITFRVGSYYEITSSTILTFISIITTYIIVLLQVF